MKKLVTVVICALLFAGKASCAEVLWYTIDSGSSLEMSDEAGVGLTGKIGLSGCAKDRQIGANDTKTAYGIYAAKSIPSQELQASPKSTSKRPHCGQQSQ
jgi:hypothetical protein